MTMSNRTVMIGIMLFAAAMGNAHDVDESDRPSNHELLIRILTSIEDLRLEMRTGSARPSVSDSCHMIMGHWQSEPFELYFRLDLDSGSRAFYHWNSYIDDGDRPLKDFFGGAYSYYAEDLDDDGVVDCVVSIDGVRHPVVWEARDRFCMWNRCYELADSRLNPAPPIAADFENSPPIVLQQEAQPFKVKMGNDVTVNVRHFFDDSDPGERDKLTITAESRTPDLFDVVGLNGFDLVLRGKQAGAGTIELFATDPEGARTTGIAIRVDIE
ncbi:MAG: hypothetical protein OXJ90_13685 [Spirochaetaceae bacterium]|nr:hypothetical protein [Spirochaetaceae bacterium]